MKEPLFKKEYLRRMKFFVKRFFIKIRLFWQYGTTDFFDSLNIEINSACNRKCSYCPNAIFDRGLLKNQKKLPRKVFDKIIKELSEINYRGKISFAFYNEPLLDDRIFDLISHARKNLPKCEIGLFTNGDYLTEEVRKNLWKSGIDRLLVSRHKDPNYKFNLLNNRCGLVQPVNCDYFPRCKYEDFHAVIDFRGNWVICCNDYLSASKVGNVEKEKIMDIWDNPGYKRLRKDLEKNIFKMGICKKCVGIDE